MSDQSASARRRAAEILEWARDCLGPAAEHLFQAPESQARALARIRAGGALEDAVLALVFERARTDRELADEFLAYFLGDLMRLERPRLRGGLRRFLDTGDLVQSVLGDLWPVLASVRFENRASFVSYLSKRLSSKAVDQARRMGRLKRREDLRVDLPPEDLGLADPESSVSSRLVQLEERDRLILLLLKLPERDRKILTLHLRGEPLERIGAEIGLEPESARKALQRALRKARMAGERSRAAQSRSTRAPGPDG